MLPLLGTCYRKHSALQICEKKANCNREWLVFIVQYPPKFQSPINIRCLKSTLIRTKGQSLRSFMCRFRRAYSKNAPDSAPEKICGPEKGDLAPMRSKWTGKFDVWTGIGPEDKKEERPREGRSLCLLVGMTGFEPATPCSRSRSVRFAHCALTYQKGPHPERTSSRDGS